MATLSRISTYLINTYQKTVSPDHGLINTPFFFACCKFYPSCSEYTKRAIQKHGFLYGLGMGVWRILRCNPLAQGGHDPV